MLDLFGIKKLKQRIADLEKQNKLLVLEVSDIVKHKFNEVSNSFDRLILTEADNLRAEWKQFEKHNKKLFQYKENK